jgi:late competence protein required for DNA uptake (superfamily II DNA/RNA helicase)
VEQHSKEGTAMATVATSSSEYHQTKINHQSSDELTVNHRHDGNVLLVFKLQIIKMMAKTGCDKVSLKVGKF